MKFCTKQNAGEGAGKTGRFSAVENLYEEFNEVPKFCTFEELIYTFKTVKLNQAGNTDNAEIYLQEY